MLPDAQKREKLITGLVQELRGLPRTERNCSYTRVVVLTSNPMLGVKIIDGFMTRQQILGDGPGSLARTNGHLTMTDVPPDWDSLPEHQRNHERRSHTRRPIPWSDVVEIHIYGVHFNVPETLLRSRVVMA